MGKRLIQQRRGSGRPLYKANTFKAYGKIGFRKPDEKEENVLKGIIKDLIKDPIHYAPLAEIVYEDGTKSLIPAPEGVRVGEEVYIGKNAVIKPGSILPLNSIPDGTNVYNIELKYGDGGKLVRSSGSFAKVINHIGEDVVIELPSRKKIIVSGKNRAVIGVIAGGGRIEKPFIKAGAKEKYMRAHSKLARWPRVKGVAMNAVDHPLGGKHRKKGKPTTISTKKHPPGARFGHLRARRTGVRK
jgi:large subunit ribosomal protein L2